jgi:hypothetical protein
MELVPHHQCFLYDGSPALNLPCLGKALREMLSRNYRCLYLNSEPMAEAMQAYLADAGVDVDWEMQRGSLVLSSDRGHLMDGHFDLKSMLAGLTTALDQALEDGFTGLFATGDMSWEFGPAADFSQLMEYEWQLEDFFEAHPQLRGDLPVSCQQPSPRGDAAGADRASGNLCQRRASLPNPHFDHPRLAQARSVI